jgi:YYY domain-containing protein
MNLPFMLHFTREFAAFLGSPNMLVLLRWWSYLLLSGILFYPLGRRLFPFAFDRGYAFAKILGILLPSWLLWMGSSLKFGLFTFPWSLGGLLLSGIAVQIFFRKNHPLLSKKLPWKILAGEEIFFLLALTGWAFIRSFQPDIQGLEKFMDFGFVNAVLRAESMPPTDMWLAGEAVNYYYFGQVICAYLIAGSRVLPEYGYNLMIATLFALTGLGSFSLGAALGMRIPAPRGDLGLTRKRLRALAAGLAAATLVTLGGNLHAFLFGELFPRIHKTTYFESTVKTSYWYPDATRYVGHNPETKDKTIHEFPIYSFVVADLHGHVSNIPVVLASLGVTLSAFIRGPGILHLLLTGLLLGITLMTNAWDFPIYLTLWGGAMVWYFWKRGSLLSGIFKGAFLGILGGLSALGAAAPFLLHFQNFSQGVHPVMSRSALWQLFVLWGDKLFMAYCFALLLGVLLFRACKREGFLKGLGRWWRRLSKSDLFAAGLFLGALGLVLLPELVYVKDIYGTTYHRSNTMFKLGYQAFILFGIASGYAMCRILSATRDLLRRIVFCGLFLLVLAAPLCYPLHAVPGYYPLTRTSRDLRGMDFLSSGDYEAVQWLREHASSQETILEAEGDSYSEYGRISMATGLPTLLGWYVHEWLWRNDSSIPKTRRQEVNILYNAPRGSKAEKLWDRYDIRYIILSPLERKRYPKLDEEGLESLGTRVFEAGETRIIERRPPQTKIDG